MRPWSSADRSPEPERPGQKAPLAIRAPQLAVLRDSLPRRNGGAVSVGESTPKVLDTQVPKVPFFGASTRCPGAPVIVHYRGMEGSASMKRRLALGLLGLLTVGLMGSSVATATVGTELILGNPSCDGLKIDPVEAGTYNLPNGGTIT